MQFFYNAKRYAKNQCQILVMLFLVLFSASVFGSWLPDTCTLLLEGLDQSWFLEYSGNRYRPKVDPLTSSEAPHLETLSFKKEQPSLTEKQIFARIMDIEQKQSDSNYSVEKISEDLFEIRKESNTVFGKIMSTDSRNNVVVYRPKAQAENLLEQRKIAENLLSPISTVGYIYPSFHVISGHQVAGFRYTNIDEEFSLFLPLSWAIKIESDEWVLDSKKHSIQLRLMRPLKERNPHEELANVLARMNNLAPKNSYLQQRTTCYSQNIATALLVYGVVPESCKFPFPAHIIGGCLSRKFELAAFSGCFEGDHLGECQDILSSYQFTASDKSTPFLQVNLDTSVWLLNNRFEFEKRSLSYKKIEGAASPLPSNDFDQISIYLSKEATSLQDKKEKGIDIGNGINEIQTSTKLGWEKRITMGNKTICILLSTTAKGNDLAKLRENANWCLQFAQIRDSMEHGEEFQPNILKIPLSIIPQSDQTPLSPQQHLAQIEKEAF